ncbi:MAG: sigma-70 family RNA polymerase sigma factor [Polyangiaceae bacterium]|nr:sigma-70 family RNA polymerase sigma factor [Polyangiaceae bacterium]
MKDLDRHAADALYRSYGPVVLRRARRILGNADEAHEVLQEVFASLIDAPDQIPNNADLLNWFYAVTTHRCLNRLRDARNRARLLSQHGAAASDHKPASMDIEVGVRAFLVELSDELARVAVFFFLDEMTHDEIAEVVGCSRRQVGYLLDQVRRLAERRQL